MAMVRIGSVAGLAIAWMLLAADVAGQTSGIRLRPGDQLDLQIKNEPELSGQYTVTPEGAAMLPLIGRVDVVDRNFAEVEAAIREMYEKELADADLLVTPLQRVAVLGEVRLPGFQWVDPMATARDAITLSGGFTQSANVGSVTLLRDGSETRFSLDDDEREQPLIALRSGDALTVGRRSWIRENVGILVGAAASVAAAAVTSLIVR